MRKIAIVISFLALAGCWKKDLTPEQKALLSQLNEELQRTKQEIVTVNSSNNSGGLIKALSDARVEILKTNQALIEQRMLSIETGAPVKVEATASLPDDALATSLAAEIASVKAKIAAANAEAAQYSGGLLQIVKLSVAATQEQSLAMLEQKYLIAKYGLAQPILLGATAVPKESQSLPAEVQRKASIPPADGPLGLAAGLNVSEIEGMSGESLTLLDEAQNLYGINKTPKPNQSFEKFALVISPTVGLCQIRAVGNTINTNVYGHQLKSSYTEMRDALASIYGRPETLDRLMDGSLWKDPDDWMMGLYKKDRVLFAEWKSTKSSPLKSNLESITMEARAQGTDKGYYLVQYDFSNYSVCESEEKSKRTGSL